MDFVENTARRQGRPSKAQQRAWAALAPGLLQETDIKVGPSATFNVVRKSVIQRFFNVSAETVDNWIREFALDVVILHQYGEGAVPVTEFIDAFINANSESAGSAQDDPTALETEVERSHRILNDTLLSLPPDERVGAVEAWAQLYANLKAASPP